MIRIKDFNTAWWGRVRSARQPYPCHPNVNAFVGASGAGKTTAMDALRLILGDAKFENNRPMDHYIHPKSNWAVVRASFHNRQEDGHPFSPEGYRQDEVTICVRLDRSRGTCEREYYVFDGPFHDIVDLGKNPRLYKERVFQYRDYLAWLERIGITRAFRQLMTMSPDDVRDVVSMPPHRLFDLVFNLKGTKRIQQNHEDARRKLSEVQTQEGTTERELEQAEIKLAQFEQAKRLFEENEERRSAEKRNRLILQKLTWWEIRTMRQREQADQIAAITERDRLKERLGELDAETGAITREISDVETQRHRASDREEAVGRDKDNWVLESDRVRQARELKAAERSRLQALPAEDLGALEQERTRVYDRAGEARGRTVTTGAEVKRLQGAITLLESGQGGAPEWVARYQRALSQSGVQGIMLADCMEVRKEYEPWLRAIEARLGLDRYRIIVPAAQQLTAKRLQEEHQYRARVSLPRAPRREASRGLLKGRYPTIRQALNVDHVQMVGGYLDHLNEIYLVDTVEEGHALQHEGYTTLTRKGLLQDDDGSLFLEARELVCGRLARDRHRRELQNSLTQAEGQYQEALTTARELEEQVRALDGRIQAQRDRARFPQVEAEWEALCRDEAAAAEELDKVKSMWLDVRKEINALWEKLTEITSQKTGREAERRRMADAYTDKERQIVGYRNRLAQLQNDLGDAENELRTAGLDDHAIAWIDHEEKEGIFLRGDGTAWARADLRAYVHELQRQMELFGAQHPGISREHIAMVDPQKNRVEMLRGLARKAKEEREEWEERLSEAETALRHHVRETMDQYIDEFRTLASLLGAEVKGRFDQEGNSPEQWRLILKIGFNGKEPVPYYEPGLSSGERAVTSIMLLLAALNNRKENQRTSMMFLDEPTARVDDERANEVGTLLQLTDIQYFITHQTSASLLSVDWIDHAFVTSKLRPGDDFANDIIFEARRVVV